MKSGLVSAGIKYKKQSRIWYFREAQQHMKEVIRRAAIEGPQRVRIYGNISVVFTSAHTSKRQE